MILGPYLDAPDKGGVGGGEEDSEARDLAELSEEEETSEEEESPESKDEEEEEEEERDDDEGDDDKDTEEDEEDGEEEEKPEKQAKEEGGRPTLAAIRTKYPDVFKDFPALKAAYFTLPKFQEVFADPEAAREASEKSDAYDLIEGSLSNGDPTVLVKELGTNNPQAMRKVAERFAETLRQSSRDDYIALSVPIIEDLLENAYKHGLSSKDKNLELAARHLANFVFANGGEIPDSSKRSSKRGEVHPAEKALNEERATFAREKLQSVINELDPLLQRDLVTTISNKLDGLTSFERKAIIKDTQAEVDDALKSDTTFQTTLKALWKKAADSGYTVESRSRIRSHWINRARELAPAIRNRLKQEALVARKGDIKEEKTKKRTFPTQGGVASKGGVKVLDPHKIDWRHSSDADILSEDTSRVKLRH